MVSNIGDQYKQDFPQKWPQFYPEVQREAPTQFIWHGVSQADFDALRKEVLELKELLLAAKKFDKATGQPHCEIDDKVALIKKIAGVVGVDLVDVFDGANRH